MPSGLRVFVLYFSNVKKEPVEDGDQDEEAPEQTMNTPDTDKSSVMDTMKTIFLKGEESEIISNIL